MPDKSQKKISGERIAKVMARAGLASRRQAEAWIEQGRVAVNGAVISSPALNVTNSDPEGRPTVFDNLPSELPRVLSIGRLDINTEGLLLLTNDGGLSRVLELPTTGWLRRYRVRANGRIDQATLDGLRNGVTVEGVRYGPIEATLEREQGANSWLMFAIREGKNREIKKILESLGLRVNRLIRVAFGPFMLGDLDEGMTKEIESAALRAELGEKIVAESAADFDAPLVSDEDRMHARRQNAKRLREATRRNSGPGIGPGARSDARQRNDFGNGNERTGNEKIGGARNQKKKPKRRDRTGGPRPKYPRVRE
jgi:23S rRNA pseudouridine2605 synthase